MLTRIALLLSLAWIMTLTEPLFSIPVLGKEISGRDLILIGGGLFLLWKSVHEIHGSLEGEEDEHATATGRAELRRCHRRRSRSSTSCSRSIPSSPRSAWSTRSRSWCSRSSSRSGS